MILAGLFFILALINAVLSLAWFLLLDETCDKQSKVISFSVACYLFVIAYAYAVAFYVCGGREILIRFGWTV